YTPEIDMYLYNQLSKALGSEDHAKSSELLERYVAASTQQNKAPVVPETETQQRSQNHTDCSEGENSSQEQINEDKTPLRADDIH
ncbi:hypothetical protein LCGC14_2974140, partial [marine sediment metagenome]